MSAPTNDRSTFKELVELAADGSDEAVWTLLDRYSKNILRVVRRHLPAEIRSKVDSTDIVQSVWKSLLRNEARFDSDCSPEQLIAYLAGMARLKVYETHRHFTTMKGDVHREQSLSSHAEDPARTVEVNDNRTPRPDVIASARENWTRAIDITGERGRKIVDMRLRGLTLLEISTEMNVSLSTVRRVLDALLQSLST
jgi:RNA polymerase sigma factor (sigma-70 family)